MSQMPERKMCPECGSTEIISISMILDEGAIRFRNCHGCEGKWWERDGAPVPLSSVLSLVPRR